MTLQEFFVKHRGTLSEGKTIDFYVRCGEVDCPDGYPTFYIRPDGVDGDTLDFYVIDNQVYPINESVVDC